MSTSSSAHQLVKTLVVSTLFPCFSAAAPSSEWEEMMSNHLITLLTRAPMVFTGTIDAADQPSMTAPKAAPYCVDYKVRVGVVLRGKAATGLQNFRHCASAAWQGRKGTAVGTAWVVGRQLFFGTWHSGGMRSYDVELRSTYPIACLKAGVPVDTQRITNPILGMMLGLGEDCSEPLLQSDGYLLGALAHSMWLLGEKQTINLVDSVYSRKGVKAAGLTCVQGSEWTLGLWECVTAVSNATDAPNTLRDRARLALAHKRRFQNDLKNHLRTDPQLFFADRLSRSTTGSREEIISILLRNPDPEIRALARRLPRK